MAENGVELQHGDAAVPDEHHVTRNNPDPVPFSNGNPFLTDLEKSSSPLADPGRELPVHSEILIDFGGPSEAAVPAETRGGPPPPSQAAVDQDQDAVTDVRLLDDFDPLQRSPGDGAKVDNMAEPEVVATTDLLGMMDPHGRPGFVEVFGAPPPGPPPEEEDVEPEVAVTSPEVTSPPSEVTSQPGGVTSPPPELMMSPVDDVVRCGGDGGKESGKDGGHHAVTKVGGGTAAKASGGGGSKIATKTSGSGATKGGEHVEARPDRKGKASPRPGSTSQAGGAGGGGPAAAAMAGGGGVEKPKDGATKATDASSAKSKTALPTKTAPKSATPSAESPKKTRSAIKRTGDAEGEKTSLSSSKTDSQRNVESATRKSRNSSSADDSGIKSPMSPGPTPRTSSSARSKIGSLDNSKYMPGGGNVRIPTQKIDVSNVTSKCGSKANMTHVPGGGQKKIESRKLDWKVESKVGSMDNAKHRPGGGEKKIESKKLEWKGESKVGSMDNAQHKPGGGEKKIETVKLDFKDKAQPKIGSKDYIDHKPGGGTKKIETLKLDFKEKAQSKVGSMPGDNQQIDDQNNLNSDETATSPRTESVAERAEEGAVQN